MNSSKIGNIGQAKVVSKFTEMGIETFLPFGDGSKYDLIAEFNGKLNKIQIKTTKNIKKNSCITWRLCCQNGRNGNQKKYNNDEVDYFALYCIETDVLCLVPFCNAQTTELNFRMDNYKGKKLKNMNFCSEYTFDKIIVSK